MNKPTDFKGWRVILIPVYAVYGIGKMIYSFLTGRKEDMG